MNAISIITCGISLVLYGMSLALAIVLKKFHKTTWTSWLIVFISCLLGVMGFEFLNGISRTFMNHEEAQNITYAIIMIQCIAMSLDVFLLPLFAYWIVEKRFGKTQKIVFFSLSAIYLISGLISVLLGLTTIELITQTIIFTGVLIYTIVTIWRNIQKLEDLTSRHTCRAISIVSICLIPTSCVLFIYPEWASVGFSIYSIAFAIILIAYFFNRFTIDSKRTNFKSEPNPDKLALNYNITEREYTIIQCVCDGMTNKEIASKLNISVNTVNNHIAKIFEKTKVKSRVDLLRTMQNGPWS